MKEQMNVKIMWQYRPLLVMPWGRVKIDPPFGGLLTPEQIEEIESLPAGIRVELDYVDVFVATGCADDNEPPSFEHFQPCPKDEFLKKGYGKVRVRLRADSLIIQYRKENSQRFRTTTVSQEIAAGNKTAQALEGLYPGFTRVIIETPEYGIAEFGQTVDALLESVGKTRGDLETAMEEEPGYLEQVAEDIKNSATPYSPDTDLVTFN